MAHELCHLLHDRGRQPQLFLISPRNRARRGRGRNRWELFDGFLDIEQRANAFAAHFLAPERAVRASLDGSNHAPATPRAAWHVASTFGVGYETAVNILWRAYGLRYETRKRLLRRSREPETTFPYDEEPGAWGLFEGQLQELALEAFAAGRLTRVEVRHLLELSMSDPLPANGVLDEAQRRPVVSEEQVALKQSTSRVIALAEEQGRHLGVGELSRDGAGWRAEVLEFVAEGGVASVGTLTLTSDFDVKRAALR